MFRVVVQGVGDLPADRASAGRGIQREMTDQKLKFKLVRRREEEDGGEGPQVVDGEREVREVSQTSQAIETTLIMELGNEKMEETPRMAGKTQLENERTIASQVPSVEHEIAAWGKTLTGISGNQTLGEVSLEAFLQQGESRRSMSGTFPSPLDGQNEEKREMLREWGFSLTPDPTAGYLVAPGVVVTEDSTTGTNDSLNRLEQTERSEKIVREIEKPAEESEHSRMEYESEDSAIRGPKTLLGKRKEKIVSTEEEEENTATTKGCRKKANRKAQKMAEKDKEEEPVCRTTRTRAKGQASPEVR